MAQACPSQQLPASVFGTAQTPLCFGIILRAVMPWRPHQLGADASHVALRERTVQLDCHALTWQQQARNRVA